MQLQAIILALASIVSLGMAAPTPKPQSSDAVDNSGGRFVLPGAQCTEVQGRTVCDDGLGNTL